MKGKTISPTANRVMTPTTTVAPTVAQSIRSTSKLKRIRKGERPAWSEKAGEYLPVVSEALGEEVRHQKATPAFICVPRDESAEGAWRTHFGPAAGRFLAGSSSGGSPSALLRITGGVSTIPGVSYPTQRCGVKGT